MHTSIFEGIVGVFIAFALHRTVHVRKNGAVEISQASEAAAIVVTALTIESPRECEPPRTSSMPFPRADVPSIRDSAEISQPTWSSSAAV